jgi:group I intron endonuclease
VDATKTKGAAHNRHAYLKRTGLIGLKYVRPNPRTKYVGVYAITHLPSGRRYIGGSLDMTGRRTHHRFTLRRGSHKTVALQALWSSSGEANFIFEVLEFCGPEDLLACEQKWLDRTPDHLNTSPMAITSLSAKPSLNRKMAAIKRWKNPAYRAKQKAAILLRASTENGVNPVVQHAVDSSREVIEPGIEPPGDDVGE